jgi:CspA family cold shock protein
VLKQFEQGARTGVVVSWKEDRGFGFIRPDAGDHDLFAHVTNLVDIEEPRVGTRVSFDDGVSERSGKPEARNIRLRI